MSGVDIIVSVASGSTSTPLVTYRAGVATQPVGIGSDAEWVVTADGVAPVHLFVAFDGTDVFVAAASSRSEVLLSGAPIGKEWHPAPAPADIRFGNARLVITHAANLPEGAGPPSSTPERTVHDGGALFAAAQRAMATAHAGGVAPLQGGLDATAARALGAQQGAGGPFPMQPPAAGRPAPPLRADQRPSGAPPPFSQEATLMRPGLALGAPPPHGQPAPPPEHGQAPAYAQPPAHGQPPAYAQPPAHGQAPAYAQPPAHGQPPAYAQPPAQGAPPAYAPPPAYASPPGYGPPAGTQPAANVGIATTPPAAKESFWKSASPVKKVTLFLLPVAAVLTFLAFGQEDEAPPAETVKAAPDAGRASTASTATATTTGTPSTAPTPAADAAVAIAEVDAAVAEPVATASAKPEARRPLRERDKPTGKDPKDKKSPERAAIDAVAAGSTLEAAAMYEALARDNPGNLTFKEAARILRARANPTERDER